MNEADVLESAADYIEEHGWFQAGAGGGVVSSRGLGAACASVACQEAADLADLADEVWIEAVRSFARWLGGTDQHHVFAWNDAEHRTQEQVVKELRACAADLRERTHA